MMRYLLYLVIIVTLNCCKNSVENNKSSYDLSVMKGYPNGFLGCGCAFALNEEAYKNQEFIYLEKYGMVNKEDNFKIISINGEQIKWTKSETSKDFILKTEYDTSEVKDQEVVYKKGRLTLKFSDGSVLKKDFVGYCGC